MRHYGFAALLAIVLASFAVVTRPSTTTTREKQVSQAEVRTCSASFTPVRFETSQTRTTRLIGADAAGFIGAKEMRDYKFRQARARAATRALSRGWRPTSIAVVVTMEGVTVSEPSFELALKDLGERVREFFMPTLKAQTYVEDGVETIYESWTDGDDDTWEGHVYAQQFSTGHFVSGIHQKNVVVDNYLIHWAEVNSSEPEGGQGPPYDCRRTGSDCGYCNDPYAPDCNLRTAVSNWWYTCSGSALGCVFPSPGPNWALCIGSRCGGVLGIGWLYYSKEHFGRCYLSPEHRAFCEG